MRTKYSRPHSPRRALLLLFSIVCLSPGIGRASADPVAAPARPYAAQVDALANETLARHRIPGGYVIAVLEDGKPAVVRAYGWAAPGTRMTTDRVFPIASVTKTFVGTLAAKLAADGRIDLEAPVTKSLPAGVTLHTGFADNPPTLRQLLTHSARLPDDHTTRRNLVLDLPGGFDPSIADPSSYGRAEFERGLPDAAPVTVPPSGHRYSNLGFSLAGYVLERRTGQPLERLLRTEILDPLGLADTGASRTPAQEARVPQGYAYDDARATHVAVPAWRAGEIFGGAGLSSTIDDLARYVGCMIERSCTERLVGRRGDRELLAPRIEYVRAPETHYWQGLGWRMSTFGPHGTFHRHNGHADGHNAFVAFSRQHRLAVIVLTNASHAAMEELGNQILLTVLQADRRGRATRSEPPRGPEVARLAQNAYLKSMP